MDDEKTILNYSNWIIQWAFATIASSIISGAMAERANLTGWICLVIWFHIMVYPFVCHWIWCSSGWLNNRGFTDFAGGAVIHMTGGFTSLIGCLIIGKRSGTPKASSIPFVVLGTLILWMGWYGFNGASTTMWGNEVEVAHDLVNTTLAAVFAGLTVTLIYFFIKGKYIVPEMCNGILIGLVAITACANTVYPWAAVVIGLTSGVTYVAGVYLMEFLKIDDAIMAFPIHGLGGLQGILMGGLFNKEKGWFYASYDEGMGPQTVGALVVVVWTVVMMSIFLVPAKLYGLLRADKKDECIGLDKAFHLTDNFVANDDCEEENEGDCPEYVTEGVHNGTDINAQVYAEYDM